MRQPILPDARAAFYRCVVSVSLRSQVRVGIQAPKDVPVHRVCMDCGAVK